MRIRWWTASLAVPIAAVAALALFHSSRSGAASPTASSLPSRSILVFPGSGLLEYRRAGLDWRLWTPGVRILEGDSLRTLDEGVRAFLDGGAIELWLDRGTAVRFEGAEVPGGGRRTRLGLATGRLTQCVPATEAGEDYGVRVESTDLRTSGAVFEVGNGQAGLDVLVVDGRVELAPSSGYDVDEIVYSIALDAQEGLTGYRSLADYELLGRDPPPELVAEMRHAMAVRRLSREEAEAVERKLETRRKKAEPETGELPGEARTPEEKAIRDVIRRGRDAILAENYEELRELTTPEFLVNGQTFDHYLEYVLDIRALARIVGFQFRSLSLLASGEDRYGLALFRIDLLIARGEKVGKRWVVGRILFTRNDEGWRAVEVSTERE